MWNASLIVEVGETKSLVYILNKEKKSDYLTAIKLSTWHNSKIYVNAKDDSGGD